MATTITLIPSTTHGTITGNYDGTSTSFASDNVKGTGYYGYSDGLHTCEYSTHNLTATLVMQGTLVSQPTETDWATIDSTKFNAVDSYDVVSFNFRGNYVWVRCLVTDFTSGTILKVMYNKS